MPLKIVHVSNFRHRPKGAGYFSMSGKISRALTRLGHAVHDFSDRDVADGLAPFRARRLGIAPCNRLLGELCQEFAPDVLLLGHADIIQPETVAGIRARLPHLRVAQWNVDPLFEPDNVTRLRRKLAVVDMTFVSTGQPLLRETFGREPVAFLPNPADPAIERHRNFEHAELPADLLLAVGNGREVRHHAGVETTAEALVDRIRAAVSGLRFRLGGIAGQPHLVGRAYEEALAGTAMGISFSRRNDVPLYASDRMAQLAGNGLLVVVDRAAGFDAIFAEDEMAFYATEAEMLDALRRFTAESAARMAVAARGWAAYHRRFGADRVAAYMLGAVLGETDPESFRWAD